MYDFGKEMFAFLQLEGVDLPNGETVCIYYGESEEEAVAWDTCELITELPVENGNAKTPIQKAFRYVTFSVAVDDAIYWASNIVVNVNDACCFSCSRFPALR